jgi:histone deacetylase 11
MIPLIYSSNYNIKAYGIEKLHPFDSSKYEKIHDHLVNGNIVDPQLFIEPTDMVSDEIIAQYHTKEYIESLDSSVNVATIVEVPIASCLPISLIRNKLLKPMRYQAAGTIMAARLAVERGLAINLGGGFHHAYSDNGGGFCVFADITMAINILREENLIQRAMIIDLDAHQGNGHERDFTSDENVYIFDIYNSRIYPHDRTAKKGISKKLEIDHNCTNEEYLELLETELPLSIQDFNPDFILYNAGTDCLVDDPLGNLNVTPEGIAMRDEIVFRCATEGNIPIAMVLSGGYQLNNATVIALSIENLIAKFGIQD